MTQSTAKKEKLIFSENARNLTVIFQQLQRVEPFAVFSHFKMHMRPGRPAGGTDPRDHIAGVHRIALGNVDAAAMTVKGLQSVIMAQNDILSGAAVFADSADLSVIRGVNLEE